MTTPTPQKPNKQRGRRIGAGLAITAPTAAIGIEAAIAEATYMNALPTWARWTLRPVKAVVALAASSAAALLVLQPNDEAEVEREPVQADPTPVEAEETKAPAAKAEPKVETPAKAEEPRPRSGGSVETVEKKAS